MSGRLRREQAQRGGRRCGAPAARVQHIPDPQPRQGLAGSRRRRRGPGNAGGCGVRGVRRRLPEQRFGIGRPDADRGSFVRAAGQGSPLGDDESADRGDRPARFGQVAGRPQHGGRRRVPGRDRADRFEEQQGRRCRGRAPAHHRPALPGGPCRCRVATSSAGQRHRPPGGRGRAGGTGPGAGRCERRVAPDSPARPGGS